MGVCCILVIGKCLYESLLKKFVRMHNITKTILNIDNCCIKGGSGESLAVLQSCSLEKSSRRMPPEWD